jgi:hypothetical protein
MINLKTSFAAALVTVGALCASGAQAANVQWSVGINLPVVGTVISNAPVYAPAPVYYPPAPVYYEPAPVYYQPPPRVIYRPAPVVVRPVPVIYRPGPGWGPRHDHGRGWDRGDWRDGHRDQRRDDRRDGHRDDGRSRHH